MHGNCCYHNVSMATVITRHVFLLLLSISAIAQHNLWEPQVAIRYSMDAEGFHFAPAVGFGVRKNFSEHWSLNSGYTFFQSPFTGATDFKFNLHTLDILSNYHFSTLDRGFFIGLGLAFQIRNDEYYRFKNKKDLMLAFNFGYDFKIKVLGKVRPFTVDTKAFGPVHYYGTTEILTQFMVGLRIRFVNNAQLN